MKKSKTIFDANGDIIKLDPNVSRSELEKELTEMNTNINNNINQKFAELNQKLDKKFNQIDKI